MREHPLIKGNEEERRYNHDWLQSEPHRALVQAEYLTECIIRALDDRTPHSIHLVMAKIKEAIADADKMLSYMPYDGRGKWYG